MIAFIICVIIWQLVVALFLLPWHLTVLALVVYTLRWTNGQEHTGAANWPRFRTAFSIPCEEGHPLWDHRSRCIYILTPCARASWTLMRTVGLCDAGAMHTHYVLPAWYFWVPGVRDVLLWTGAIAQSEEAMLSVLQKERNVSLASVDAHPLWFFTMAMSEHISLCLITVREEGQLDCGVVLRADAYSSGAQLSQALDKQIAENIAL